MLLGPRAEHSGTDLLVQLPDAGGTVPRAQRVVLVMQRGRGRGCEGGGHSPDGSGEQGTRVFVPAVRSPGRVCDTCAAYTSRVRARNDE